MAHIQISYKNEAPLAVSSGSLYHEEVQRLITEIPTDAKPPIVSTYKDPNENCFVVTEGLLFGITGRTENPAAAVYDRYVTDGIASLLDISGEYAILIYDATRGMAFGFHDKMDVCPLYYGKLGANFHLGSNLSIFPRVAEKTLSLDEPHLAHYLINSIPDMESTPFKEVKSLKRGQYLTYSTKSDKVKLVDYWDIFKTKAQFSPEALKTTLSTVVQDRVDCFPNSPQIGVALSGGLDSSTVFALAHETSDKKVIGFHNEFGDMESCDELEYASAVTDNFDAPMKVLKCNELWPLQGFPDAWPTTGEPGFVGVHAMISAHIRLAKTTGVPLLLTGHGGDPLFTGGPDDLPALLRPRFVNQLGRAIAQESDVMGRSYWQVISEYIVKPMFNPGLTLVEKMPNWLTQHTRKTFRPIRGHWFGKRGLQIELLYFRLAPWVASDLAFPLGIAMSHPYWDHRVVELACQLTWEQRGFTGDGSKIALRNISRSLLPPKVAERQHKAVHQEFLLKGIRAEQTALLNCFEQDTHLYELGFVDKKEFIGALNRLFVGDTTEWSTMIRAISLEVWLRRVWKFLKI